MARHNLDNSLLIELWQWSEAMFLDKTQGSPLRRTGYVNFLRNLAIGIGNAPYTADNITALESRLGTLGDVLDEHIHWAIAEQQAKAN